MTNKELAAQCLINASDILSECSLLTEAVGKNDPASELEDAIKKKDPNKIIQKINEFNKWLVRIDPEDNHINLNRIINIAIGTLSMVTMAISYFTGFTGVAGGIIFEGWTKNNIVKIIIGVTTFVGTIVGLTKYVSFFVKVNTEDAKKKVDSLKKSADKLKRELDDMEDKRGPIYKSANKLYDRTLSAIQAYESLLYNEKLSNRTIEAKKELREAKKAKDKDKIAATKNELKRLRNGLMESIGDDCMEDYMILTEAASLLLEEASNADCLEDAQELIEKAKELQEKALEKLEDCNESKDDEDDDDDKKDVVQETIDMLLEAAVMCENGEDANVYIEKAEELQKAIEDIPEERAIEDDDYPAEVSGGDGYREDHLEDIKDLVDNDKKAVDILTIDEDSLTID